MKDNHSLKQLRTKPSRAPLLEPTQTYHLHVTVGSRLLKVVTDTSPIIHGLLGSTSWEELGRIARKAACEKIRQFARAWEGSAVTLVHLIGNMDTPLSFSKTKGYNLGMYPCDSDNGIHFEVHIAKRTPPVPGTIRLVSMMKAPSSKIDSAPVAHRRRRLRTIQHQRLNQRQQARSKRVILEIRFPELKGFNNPKPIIVTVQANADHDEIRHSFAKSIRSVIEPEYLKCLLLWTAEVGTHRDGFEKLQATKASLDYPGAEPGRWVARVTFRAKKLLCDYPGAGRGHMIARVNAGLMEPTIFNMVREKPDLLTNTPTLDEFLRWMDPIARMADEAERASLVSRGEGGNLLLNTEIEELKLEQASNDAKLLDKRVATIVRAIRARNGFE